jgi:hypothetical protein
MIRSLPVVLLVCFVVTGISAQQKILLVGTKHQTPERELVQIKPVYDAVVEFNPDIICTEYRKPNDSTSLRYLYGKNHFRKQDSLRRAWNIPKKSDKKRIGELMNSLKKRDDISLRMELRNIFYVRSDFGNAEYQAYLIITRLNSDSSRLSVFRKRFPMFDQMRSRYRQRSKDHDEYNFLVFPAAKTLSVDYLNPIDDQSTNNEYEKYFSRLNNEDTLLDNARSYYERMDAFRLKMQALPPETNMWVYSNSPELINELMYLEAYKIYPGNTSQEIKMLGHYWTLRNKKIASYILEVAKMNPGKNIVVFFGASHVGPVMEEFKKLSKKQTVLTLYDIIDK